MKRLASLALAALAAPALAGCGQDPLSPSALRVGGDEVISRDDFESELEGATLQDSAVAALCSGAGVGAPEGQVPTSLSSCLLSFHAQAAVVRAAAASEGVAVDDAARQGVEEELRGTIEQRGGDWAALPERLRTDILDTQALAGGDSDLLGEERLRGWFDGHTNRFGDLVCIDHILVETREEADEVLAELADGGDFAELARERSLDPGSGADGGQLPCDRPESYVGPFADASREAEVGGPLLGPVETQFGAHVLRARAITFDDVDPNVVIARFLTDRAGEVEVDGRFGRWDPDAVSVVPPEGPAAAQGEPAPTP